MRTFAPICMLVAATAAVELHGQADTHNYAVIETDNYDQVDSYAAMYAEAGILD